jgi:RNA polymerase sigma-70 factor (ECF subfamily)
VELHSFDECYVTRLRSGDPAAEREFTSYFGELLLIKLRARRLPPYVVDELRQETFLRVLSILKREAGIHNPERLGAFVNSVCDHVLLEHYRRCARFDSLEDHTDFEDKTIDLDGRLVTWQTQKSVEEVLAELSVKDQKLLRAVFLEERDKDDVCQELGVDRDYLRVLLHRAKAEFRRHFPKNRAAIAAK